MNTRVRAMCILSLLTLFCATPLLAEAPPSPSPHAFERVDSASDAGAVQPQIIQQLLYRDGRILGLGYYDTRQEQRALLVRWTANGQIDTAFGDDGVATLTNPGGTIPFHVAMDSQGRILVAALHYLNDPQARMGGIRNPGAVFRFTPDGSPDPDWGEDGILLIPDAIVRQTNWVSFMGLDVMKDDTVAVAYVHLHEAHPRRGGPDTHRIAILLLDADGTPKADFGTDGLSIPATAEPLHIQSLNLRVLEDGSFLVYGSAQAHTVTPPGNWPKALFGRLTPEGEWDERVGGGAGFTLNLLGEKAQVASVNQAVLTDVAELRGGQVLASGYWLSSSLDRKFDSFVARYRPDGTLDTAYGGRNLGYTEIIRTTKPDWAFSISTLRNGNAFVAGTDSKGGYLLQLDPNGTRVLWRREGLSHETIDFRHAGDEAGRVLITGGRANAPAGMSIRKFNASGAPDARFGRTRDGIVRVFVRRRTQ